MDLWTAIYNKTNAPMTPLYGGFPVKLTTHLGDHIQTDQLTVEELRVETISQMQKLIKKHQKLPGNVYQAVRDRFEATFDYESDEEDFIDCHSDVEEFSSSIESLTNLKDDELSDSGCASVASTEDEEIEREHTKFLLRSKNSSITKLPNGRLVLLASL